MTADAAPTGSRGRSLVRGLRRLVSRIGVRLLVFNALLVFLPLSAMLSLDALEQNLLEAQSRALTEQARLVAAALGAPAADAPAIDRQAAFRLLWRLERRAARIRIFDRRGDVVADSAELGPLSREAEVEAASERSSARRARSHWLYRLGALPFRWWQATRAALRPAAAAEAATTPEEIERLGEAMAAGALEGETATGRLAATQLAALPIRRISALPLLLPGARPAPLRVGPFPAPEPGEILGAVLVSRSTAPVLRDLGEARLGVARIVFVALLAAVLVNVFLAATIALPLRRLRREAEGLLDARGRLVGAIDRPGGHDEIGDLRQTLHRLARRLRRQQQVAESFAADAAHEIKNPLAAIRSAAEMLADVDEPAERRRFSHLLQSNVARAEQVLSSLRELAAIDAGLEEDRVLLESGSAPSCDLAALARAVAKNRAALGAPILLEAPAEGEGLRVRGRPERLEQVLDNLLDNALSFAPRDSAVRVEVARERESRAAVLRVSDSGPGIPSADLERIFERFHSYRPGTGKAGAQGDGGESGDGALHTGLGLAIVRSVVEAYGGQVVARNLAAGGAVFECRLPLAPDRADRERGRARQR